MMSSISQTSKSITSTRSTKKYLLITSTYKSPLYQETVIKFYKFPETPLPFRKKDDFLDYFNLSRKLLNLTNRRHSVAARNPPRTSTMSVNKLLLCQLTTFKARLVS